MALMFSRARVSAIAAIAAALCGRAAVAAGMPFLSAPEPAPATPPVEIGSGWYLRGDVGYESMTAPIITTDLTTLASRINNASGGIGVGFQFNQWFRADLTLDRSVNRQQGSGASMYCPYGTLVNVPNVDINGTLQTVEAYLYNPAETCTPLVNAHINRTSLIANGYFDLGNWWGVTPYVGAGIGVSYLQTSASVNYYENGTGNLWAPNLGVAGAYLAWYNLAGQQVAVNQQYPFAQLNYNFSQTVKDYKLAWNFMAGASYDISQNLKLDLHYRLLGVGSFTGFPGVLSGTGAVTKDLLSQEVRLGFRLVSD